MANLKVVGNAVVLTSKHSLEDLQKIKKYRPEALKLLGGEDGKSVIFMVGFDRNGLGSISPAGVEFGDKTHDDAGLATVTITFSKGFDDIVGAVSDAYGPALLKLNKLEDTFGDVLAEIGVEQDKIRESIAVIG